MLEDEGRWEKGLPLLEKEGEVGADGWRCSKMKGRWEQGLLLLEKEREMGGNSHFEREKRVVVLGSTKRSQQEG